MVADLAIRSAARRWRQMRAVSRWPAAILRQTQERYAPFGTVRMGGAGLPNDRRFNGNTTDIAGLLDYGARAYDPLIGRFISADTIVPNLADPQTLNRYTYGLSNPLRYTDPSGHDPKDDNGNNMNNDCDYAGWCQPWTHSGGRFDPVAYIQDEMSKNPSTSIAQLTQIANLDLSRKVLALLLWAAMVQPNGEWDHKPKIQALLASGNYADDLGAIWLQVGDEAFEYRFDVFSNIHFGYVGMAIGFNADELLEGAGYAQYLSDLRKTFPALTHYGDQSLSLVFPYDHGQGILGTSLRNWDEISDQAAIKVGIQLWVDQGSKGILPSSSQIVDAMKSNPNLLRKAKP